MGGGFRREQAPALHTCGKRNVRLSTGCNYPGCCPDPYRYKNWQVKNNLPVALCYFSIKNISHLAGVFLYVYRKNQNAQLPLRNTGTVLPSSQMASMFMESQPIMKSTWIMESLTPSSRISSLVMS